MGLYYFHETSGVIQSRSKGQIAKAQDTDATFAVVLCLHQKQLEARRPADLSCLTAQKKQIKPRQPKDL